jgi:hypothetical protein
MVPPWEREVKRILWIMDISATVKVPPKYKRFPNVAAEQLDNLMSEISDRCWCAGWLRRTEYVLWKAATDGRLTWGVNSVTPEDVSRLVELSAAAGGWIAWDDGVDETAFVPLDLWRDRYAAALPIISEEF